jgi:hypothetical protein
MARPPVEVADILRAAPDSFFERSRKWSTWLHLKIFNAILACRTSALGGHEDACSRCGHRAISFNSCRNRHCANSERLCFSTLGQQVRRVTFHPYPRQCAQPFVCRAAGS